VVQAETRARSETFICGVSGEQCCWIGFIFPSTSVYHVNIIPPALPSHSFVSHRPCTVAATDSICK